MKPTKDNAAAHDISKFAKVCGFTPDESHRDAVSRFQSLMTSLSPEARKLLAHVADLATRPNVSNRRSNAAYLPELHETCGLDVDAMYRLLQNLEQASFIRLEGDYPFQDVLLLPDSKSQWLVLADLVRFCSVEKISLRELIADVKFEALGSLK